MGETVRVELSRREREVRRLPGPCERGEVRKRQRGSRSGADGRRARLPDAWAPDKENRLIGGWSVRCDVWPLGHWPATGSSGVPRFCSLLGWTTGNPKRRSRATALSGARQSNRPRSYICGCAHPHNSQACFRFFFSIFFPCVPAIIIYFSRFELFTFYYLFL